MSKILIAALVGLSLTAAAPVMAQDATAAAAATAAAPGKLTIESTLDQLTANPAAKKILEDNVPIIVGAIETFQLGGISLAELATNDQARDQGGLTDEAIKIITEALAKL